MSGNKLYAVFVETSEGRLDGPRFGTLEQALKHVRACLALGNGDPISILEPDGHWLHFNAPARKTGDQEKQQSGPSDLPALASPPPANVGAEERFQMSKFPTPVFDYRTLANAENSNGR